MAVVSISLPDALLAEADRVLAERGFSGRSELMRASLRDFVAQHRASRQPGRRSATLTLVYPEGRERHFSSLRHTHGHVVRTMIHGHAGDSCMELYVLEGQGAEIEAFADALRGARDALQVSLAYTDAWRASR